MNLLILSLIPLILFAVINYYSDLKRSVIWSTISAFLMLILTWYILEIWDEELLLMVGFMILFGVVAIRKNDEFYFKLQPAVTAFITALIMLFFEWTGHSLIDRFVPKVAEYLGPEQTSMLANTEIYTFMKRIFVQSCYWTLLHSVVLAWAAKKATTKTWLLIKALFLPYITLIMLISIYVQR